jgi:hypothetical protein
LLFLCSYAPALIIRILIYILRPDLYPYYTIHMFVPLSPEVGWFVFDATWAATSSCLIAAVFGSLFSLRLGIAVALALSLADGIIIHTTDDIEDVSVSVKEVFDSWAAYFWDLWNLCDRDQRISLLALLALQHAEVDQIVEWSSLSKQRTLFALEKLQIRDLVTREEGRYQFAIPIFAQWVEQNAHLLA